MASFQVTNRPPFDVNASRSPALAVAPRPAACRPANGLVSVGSHASVDFASRRFLCSAGADIVARRASRRRHRLPSGYLACGDRSHSYDDVRAVAVSGKALSYDGQRKVRLLDDGASDKRRSILSLTRPAQSRNLLRLASSEPAGSPRGPVKGTATRNWSRSSPLNERQLVVS